MIEAQQFVSVMDRAYAAAQPGAVFGSPVEANGYTVITASEVAAGGGFGVGSGTAPRPEGAAEASGGGGSGGGGGGGSMARPVAVIVIGPDGVKVKPVLDVGKLALAAVTAWAAIAINAIRIARRMR
ncbi:MAG: hypothetical protein M3336_12415 [Chloroflexota bacterium]|nr:hypothetical protein [Chloroflexota bacterium]